MMIPDGRPVIKDCNESPNQNQSAAGGLSSPPGISPPQHPGLSSKTEKNCQKYPHKIQGGRGFFKSDFTETLE